MGQSHNAVKLLRKIVSTYMLDETPSSSGKHLSDSATKYQSTLARKLRQELNIDEEHVSIRRRPDNSVFLAGSTVDRILTKMGVTEKPGANGSYVQNISMRDLTVLDSVIFDHVKRKYFHSFMESEEWRLFFHLKLILKKMHPKEDDYECIRLLGRGGFGRVYACKSVITGKLYALKIMNKRRLKYRRAVKMCLCERDALVTINSPFLVSLKYAFSSKENLYFVMELMIGGDLSYHLNNGNFTNEQAKYYGARIVLGLAVLHEHYLVYRDLKPENILLDAEGHSKLSDMGLVSSFDERGLYTICGTRGYWAPEMLTVEHHRPETYYNQMVDWFSLGCCIYEFLTGMSPFRSERAQNWGHSDKNTREGRERALDLALLQMHPDLNDIRDEKAKDLIAKLLVKDPKRRLGHRGHQDIMNHPWFADIPWETLHCMPPPFRPVLKGNAAFGSEIGDFHDDTEVSKLSLQDDDQDFYRKWDYISETAAQEELVELLIYQETEVGKIYFYFVQFYNFSSIIFLASS
jgi:beta-adrenergic-receptor kinase